MGYVSLPRALRMLLLRLHCAILLLELARSKLAWDVHSAAVTSDGGQTCSLSLTIRNLFWNPFSRSQNYRMLKQILCFITSVARISWGVKPSLFVRGFKYLSGYTGVSYRDAMERLGLGFCRTETMDWFGSKFYFNLNHQNLEVVGFQWRLSILINMYLLPKCPLNRTTNI